MWDGHGGDNESAVVAAAIQIQLLTIVRGGEEVDL